MCAYIGQAAFLMKNQLAEDVEFTFYRSIPSKILKQLSDYILWFGYITCLSRYTVMIWILGLVTEPIK